MTRAQALRLLVLSEGFSSEDLKRAFRRISLKAHPDHGGSDKAMREVLEAREVLEKAVPPPYRGYGFRTVVVDEVLRADFENIFRDAFKESRAARAYASAQRREPAPSRAETRYERRPPRAPTILPDTPEAIKKRQKKHVVILKKYGLL